MRVTTDRVRAPSRIRLGASATAVATVLALGLGACSSGGSSGAAGDGTGEITAWFHSGQGPERDTLKRQVKEFNASQDDVTVKLKLLPEGSYNDQVQAASAAGDLPDVLDFDGPLLYNYVYKGKLVPLDDYVPDSVTSNLTKASRAQGTYDGKLYSLATFDSGLGVYGNRKLLDEAGVDYPRKPGESWTAREFTAALKKLADHTGRSRVLDLGLANGKGEWFTYGYSPVVWSAGGDLIDREEYRSADGVLNSPKVVDAFRTVQSWKKYTDPDTDGSGFTSGRTALSWNGHWQYAGFSEALGDDLVVLPVPDFGVGSKSGQGSWNWGITSSSKNQKAAAEFLQYLMQDEQVLAMTEANGAPPATRSAMEKSALYGPGKPLERFAAQLKDSCGSGPITMKCTTVPRPATPAYPVITSAFQKAWADIWDGGDPRAALDKAVEEIDTDIEDNDGYQQP
ncbi:sugar ABC transporter substrate-binding protein [Streptomyces sp. JJ36]|uniref:ABC transporter substrate-binding protein n=1 Tax=Streptomyces sp. JJ36 TaxID=2736645 RepID=UPI001F3D23EE|nr:sugar ABC transporter substrate-binding protein [Streptomyces sp. JJ36]MCF6525759.1 sugar ABC transporter substrate-binding protein [Streptomyces sp. JJ36]